MKIEEWKIFNNKNLLHYCRGKKILSNNILMEIPYIPRCMLKWYHITRFYFKFLLSAYDREKYENAIKKCIVKIPQEHYDESLYSCDSIDSLLSLKSIFSYKM